MPYPQDPTVPLAPSAPAQPMGLDWKQSLLALVPMMGAAFSGTGAGVGAFADSYARGLSVQEELRQREQAMRNQERRDTQRLLAEQAQERRLSDDRALEQQMRALKIMEAMGPMAESALAEAEASGLVHPTQQAEYAQRALQDLATRFTQVAPNLGVTPEQLVGGAGDLRAKASQRMLKSLVPLYERMTDEATEDQIEAFRADPRPFLGGLPFAEFEQLLPPGQRWVPKTQAAPKATSLEADLADARRRKDTVAMGEILRLMGQQAAATRKPEPAVTEGQTGYSDVGDVLLQQLSPQDAALVKGITNYTLDVTKVASMRAPKNADSERKRLVALALQVDPTYDMNLYRQVADTRREFTVGKAAQNIRSLNTAIAHIGDLSEKADALENGSLKLWNRIRNTGLSQTGDPRVTNFLTAANAVEGELAALFKGMGATDQEIKAWREVIDEAGSPAQLKGFVDTAVQLAFGRLAALKDQYVKGARVADRQFLSEKSRKILDKRGIDWRAYDDVAGTAPEAEVQMPATRGLLGPNPYRR